MLLFGIRCRFTAFVLHELLGAGADICALMIPGPPDLARPLRSAQPLSLPMAAQSSGVAIDAIAERHGIPLFQVGQLSSPESLAVVSALRPDLLAVACYPSRIPATLWRLPRLGAFNIHPSLLPDKRGPDPWFWTFRDEAAIAGVTVHQLAGRYDAGAIAAQEAWPLGDGTTEAALEQVAAERGAALLLEVVRRAERGALELHVQDESRATWASWPTADDYRLDASLSARTAFNFVRGLQGRGEPVRVGTELRVVNALSYGAQPLASDSVPAGAAQLPFRDGVLIARVTPLKDG